MKSHARAHHPHHGSPYRPHHRPAGGPSAAVKGATTEAYAAVAEGLDATVFSTLLRQGEELKIHPVLALATVAAVAFGAAKLASWQPGRHAAAVRQDDAPARSR